MGIDQSIHYIHIVADGATPTGVLGSLEWVRAIEEVPSFWPSNAEQKLRA